MKINLKISGTMERYFPQNQFLLNLDEEATLSDMYQELGKTIGHEISPAVWNHNKNRPRGPVIVRSESGVLKDDSTILTEGQTLELKRFLIGG